MSKLRTGFALAPSLLVLLNACVARTAHVAANRAPAVGPRYYIDLEPGWRVRVVTPILKGGGYRVRTAGEPGATTLKAGADFLGYEIAWYAVKARFPSGERVVFTAAEVHNKDGVVPAAQPLAPLFHVPGEARYVRLIYLVRASEADHDMAVVAASRRDALDPLTAQVRTNPQACQSQRGTFCSWIPDGIAVTPEVRTTAAGAEQWAPAN
ncbi:MAG: hypothetical protein ABSH47_06235 [Bryobacteraceae bacterium]